MGKTDNGAILIDLPCPDSKHTCLHDMSGQGRLVA